MEHVALTPPSWYAGDVVTSPTASMLAAIANTTLLDDVFQEDPTTNALEADVAELTGHEAALLVLSGTMGNQVALRSLLTQPPHAVLCDARAHILGWEAGGVASLCGALVQGVAPSNGLYLTLEDIARKVVLSDDVHACPTRVISLENTLGGSVMPLDEARRITSWARRHDIRTHLDGARLWHAPVAGAGSLTDYARDFDSVSLCFSKGLGAPVGSILVGSRPLIARARWIRKSLGGGLRQAGVISAAARVAVDETFGSGPWGKGGRLERSHKCAQRLGQHWTSCGGRLARPVETNMVWLDLSSMAVDDGETTEGSAGAEAEREKAFVALASDHGLKVLGPRLVLHYQISEEAVERMERTMELVLKRARSTTRRSGKPETGQVEVRPKTYGTG
ncbi:MAG: hypothetical protein M1838_001866 [Thelocarpon superellum]|nr:MAG: hypothetical protein M1838_001866 [Thelocarpon superellum]